MVKVNSLQSKYWEHHNTHCKVNTENTIEYDEDVLISEVFEAVVEAHGEEEHHQLEVEVEGGPGGGLVLRHGGDDGDVVLGVRGVQQRVEPARPGGYFAQGGQGSDTNHSNTWGNKYNEIAYYRNFK